MTDNPTRMSGKEQVSPISDNPKLTAMSAHLHQRRIRGQIVRMADEVEVLPLAITNSKQMPPMLEHPETVQMPDSMPEMEARTSLPPTTSEAEGYVRLRLRIENGVISIVGARTVVGPLLFDEHLVGEMVYEASTDKKRLSIGSIPDAKFRRSFADPQNGLGMEGHHVTELTSYEFNVRIPKAEFSEKVLSKLQVTVFRTKKTLPTQQLLGVRSLAEEFGEQLREVARLKGIRLDDLPGDVQEEMREVFR